ncbi:MAG: phenylacetate-CoA oxygenase subunit PaaJ [Bacteroidetes bacterium]|nr:phenylacetate-CoA oxygenase subunit PaaJ [Bacteroidota bacterium]
MIATIDSIYEVLERVTDPEVPVLTILDLGIVRKVELKEDQVVITITSTYMGCPAMDMIAAQIRMEMAAAGYGSVRIEHSIRPAWTTEWMSEAGKEKLKAYGIAPPDKRFSIPEDGVECPRCSSRNTRLVSEFGSTACKALYQCRDCQDPFDYFKCH